MATLLLLKSGVDGSEGDSSGISRWFRVLANRMRISDRHRLNSQNVRVQASSPSDWWIHVHPQGLDRHQGCGFFGHHTCGVRDGDQIALYRELREALLLTTMLSRVDYELWYEEITRTSGLRLTNSQREQRAEWKFALTLEDHATPESEGWQEQMDVLWGVGDGSVEAFSADFASTTAALRSLADAKRIKWSDVVKPVPVRLEFSQVTTTAEQQGASLDRVAHTVLRAKESHNNLHAMCDQLPSFKLQTMELYLWRHEVHPAVFSALERLLQTDIQIDFLALPGRQSSIAPDQDKLQEAWRSLVHKLIGSGSKERGQAGPQINRLEIPLAYLTPALSATWLTALSTASNVRSLSVQGQGSPTLSTSLFWGYIGNTFLHTKHSIHSLELAGLGDISTDAVAAFERVTAGELGERALQTLVLSLAPGPQPTPGLDGSLHVGPKHWIPRFLQLAGDSLTTLAIDKANVDDTMLDQCLQACPNLESFRVNGASFQSLDSLISIYDSPSGSKLTSIDLHNVSISIDAFESFLGSLSDDKTTIHSTLSRLRIGEGWSIAFRESTVAALEKLLTTNKTVTMLEVYRAPEPLLTVPVADWNHLKTYDGRSLASVDSPLPLDSRYAFLGALKSLANNGTAMAIPEDPLRIIMELAANARRRSVVVCTDADAFPFY